MSVNWENNLKVNIHDEGVELGIQLPLGGTAETGHQPPRLDFTRRVLRTRAGISHRGGSANGY